VKSATLRRTIVALAVVLQAEPSSGLDPSKAAEHLAAAIRFKTVSHQDPSEDDRTQFAALRSFLERTYPKVHRSLARELVNGDGLLYTWKGTDGSAKPVLLMAHQDVVPIEPGTEAAWTHPPFDGVIADGFVWGRGAIDDKGSLIFLMEAAESLLGEGFRPRETTYIASGFDEEVGGFEGAKKIAALLEGRGVHLGYVLDEGRSVTQGVIPDVTEPIASIGIAEKGYLSLELTIEMEGGHSSRPPAETSIGVLAAAIDRVEHRQMPARLSGAPRRELQMLAPYMPAARRWALSNLWLFGPFVVRTLASNPTTNAVVRTTTAPTIFQAGVKENVLPSKARAVVNFRILQGDSVASVIAHVREVVDDERIKVTKLERTLSEPSPESSTEVPAYRLLQRTIHEVYPDAAVIAPSLVVGATDSRHFAAVADDVYRFMPLRIGPADLKRVHGTDERFEVRQIGPAVDFYRRLLRAEP
jgi:carboxypeptidase PM20D1